MLSEAVPNRFLLHFKSCSGTVWTRIYVLLQCRNCSEAFPVWTEALPVIQCATLPFDLKRSFTKTLTKFRCNFCSDKSVQTWLRPFQKPIQYGTFHFQQQNRAVQFWSRNCFQNSQFLVWAEALFGTLSVTLRFTIWYSARNYVYKINLVPSDWRNTFHTRCTPDIQDLGSSQIVFELWHKR